MKNEEGSMLLSVLLFVSFSAFLLTGMAFAIRNQSYQYRLAQQAYEGKGMIEISVVLLENEWEATAEIVSGTIHFEEGIVTIQKKKDATFQLDATLNNGYHTSQVVTLSTQEEARESTHDETEGRANNRVEIEDSVHRE